MHDLPRKAISVRQPWAHMILYEGKPVENRSWSTNYRGPVLLHAAKSMTNAECDDALDLLEAISRQDQQANLQRRARILNDMRRGGIVGVVEIVDCVTEHPSPWFIGRYGFVLANPRPLPFVPCRGALGFFEVPDEAMADLNRARTEGLAAAEARR
ncbi:hypothetical protein VQ03_29060 [Methylobacterium tarhaniae]|uniref:Uncharacterized protein n=1 Tax=Methylobacterium tarhaniae TaxID=1187852 RepID=A0A0J6S7W2_9HYPH|nr:ASCH domain-containing protein [Methylobacterium tarhaniae]KMO29727.1 hypothetical protein VQ03_29060 [Methylobacterium tarhaniae]